MSLAHLLRPRQSGLDDQRSPVSDLQPATRCGLALVSGMIVVSKPGEAESLGLDLCPECLARSLEV